MQDILSAFPNILKEIDTDGRAVEPVVFAAWKRCVDGVLAEHVVPMRLDRNRLIVAVSNETWRRHVADLGPALARKVNSAVGLSVVDYVEFVIDAASVTTHRVSGEAEEKNAARSDAAADQQAGLAAAAASIKDDELRERFLAAAGQNLARQIVAER